MVSVRKKPGKVFTKSRPVLIFAILTLSIFLFSSTTDILPTQDAKSLIEINGDMKYEESTALAQKHVDSGVVLNDFPSSCQRKCDSRPNAIVLDHFGAAGLGDRLSIFRTLGNLAGYLCAKVFAPPPATMLSRNHNRGQPLSLKVHWDDFWLFHFWDGSVALEQYMPDSNTMLRTGKATKNYHLSELSFFKNMTRDEESWMKLGLRKNSVAIPQIQLLEEFVERQQSASLSTTFEPKAFVWYIYRDTFGWVRKGPNVTQWFETRTDIADRNSLPNLKKDSSTGCEYLVKRPSNVAESVVNYVFQSIQLQHPQSETYALFHIRRGDTIKHCDTTFPHLFDFMKCSFSNPEEVSKQFGNVTILLASDEQDPCYRQAFCKLMKNFGFGCVDLDSTVESVISNHTSPRFSINNNMFTYHISRLIAVDPRIRIVLEKRREFNCPSCVNVLEQFGPPGWKSPSSTETKMLQESSRAKNVVLDPVLEEYEACQK